MESTSDSEWGDSNVELEPKLDVVFLQAHVTAWLEDLDKAALDPLPTDVNDTNPFIPGCMGGKTANDVLMVKTLRCIFIISSISACTLSLFFLHHGFRQSLRSLSSIQQNRFPTHTFICDRLR